MTTWNEPYGIIGRGKAGWHAVAHNVSSSGGTLDGYLAHAADGALVYDAEGADYDTFSDLVIAGGGFKTRRAAIEATKALRMVLR